MSWLATSIMSTRGVARGTGGQEATILTRGRAGPVPLRLRPLCRAGAADRAGRRRRGRDPRCLRGQDHGARATSRASTLDLPFANPQNGPIVVKGAVKGDVVAVRIHDIEPRGPQPVGTTCLIARVRRRWSAPTHTAMLQRPLARGRQEDDRHARRHHLQRARSTLPYEPFIGTLGVLAARSRRSARSSPTTGAATWTCPTWRRARSPIFRYVREGALRLPRRLPRDARATASCAASRSRSRRR